MVAPCSIPNVPVRSAVVTTSLMAVFNTSLRGRWNQYDFTQDRQCVTHK
jgi:hypothetical protein